MVSPIQLHHDVCQKAVFLSLVFLVGMEVLQDFLQGQVLDGGREDTFLKHIRCDYFPVEEK